MGPNRTEAISNAAAEILAARGDGALPYLFQRIGAAAVADDLVALYMTVEVTVRVVDFIDMPASA